MKKARWLPWALMCIALATALAVGIVDADDPPTDAERAVALARTIRCPQCQGETVAESNVAIAAAIRADIRERVAQGQNDAEIRQVYANLYGNSVLLTPPGEGFGSVLWVIPIVAVVVGAAILGVAWRQRVLRQRIEPDTEFPVSAQPSLIRSSKRRWSVVGIVAVALVAAVIAGVLLARSVGFRSSSDEATGDIRQTSRGLIVRAGELTGQGDLKAAIATYDQVLSSEPSNVVALTYKGWLTWLTEDRETVGSLEGSAAEDREIVFESERLLTEAVAIDPAYPDARVFRTIIFASTNRWRMAQEELAGFDSLNPAADLRNLVDNSNIRRDIDIALAEEAVTATLALTSGATEPLTEEQVSAVLAEFTESQLNIAGVELLRQREVQPAAIVFSYLLQRNPNNLTALSGRGYLFTLPDFAETAEVFNRGIADLDRAVQIAPNNPTVRLQRAQALITSNQRLDEAKTDLDAIEASEPSDELQSAADVLRERLGEVSEQDVSEQSEQLAP